MKNNVLQSKNYKDDVNFDYSLSLSDLILVDGWKADDMVSVERVLYENGIDVSLGWHTERLLHRNLQNKVVDTIRFSGVQRRDDNWKRVGMSLEDQIANCTDSFLRSELMTISQQSNFSGSLIDQYGEEEEKIRQFVFRHLKQLSQ
jgi:hypothetical protein